MTINKIEKSNQRKELGNWGERIAEKYLKDRGYKILDRNYCFRIPGSPQKGEIDIVAKKDGTISFIEVKTLRNRKGTVSLFLPEDKVNFVKRKKIIKAAESWLMKKKMPLNSKWQIDVIAVEIKNRKTKISHFKNAISHR